MFKKILSKSFFIISVSTVLFISTSSASESYPPLEERMKTELSNEEDEFSVKEIIFYGDSRVEGMGMTCTGNVYVGKASMGYDWMAGEGLYYLTDAMANHPDADIVFCFGVNDVGNINSYINFFDNFCNQYPDRRVWYESVNPIDDATAAANGYFANNNMVLDFNAVLSASIGYRYLDTYNYLAENGFGTPDGIHYDSYTYNLIQDKTKELIEDVFA